MGNQLHQMIILLVVQYNQLDSISNLERLNHNPFAGS